MIRGVGMGNFTDSDANKNIPFRLARRVPEVGSWSEEGVTEMPEHVGGCPWA